VEREEGEVRRRRRSGRKGKAVPIDELGFGFGVLLGKGGVLIVAHLTHSKDQGTQTLRGKGVMRRRRWWWWR